MEAYVLKNVFKNALYFLEYNKSFVIKDEPHNSLEFFLVELNRLREMTDLPPFILESIVKTPSGGHQRKFVISKAKIEKPVKIDTGGTEAEAEFKEIKITKSKFIILMEELFGEDLTTESESTFDEELDKNIKTTLFYSDDVHVGTWASGKGLHKVSCYS
jgi:hypothetical protein